MTFKDLGIGDRFHFGPPSGEWKSTYRKTGPRKYELALWRKGGQAQHAIGSIKCEVTKENA